MISDIDIVKLINAVRENPDLTLQQAKKILKTEDAYLFSIWCIDDVIQIAHDYKLKVPNEDQAREILELLMNKYDASLGSTWDDLAWYIQRWYDEYEKC